MSTTNSIEVTNLKNQLQLENSSNIQNQIIYPNFNNLLNKQILNDTTTKDLENEKNAEISNIIKINRTEKFYKTKNDNNKNSQDLMRVQEFLPENIKPAFEEIKNKDFFEFTDENDKKYDFYKVKYIMRSKTMIKAFYWSVGIGLSMFCHRYYRKQNLKRSIFIGTATMGVSFILVWANFELNPFLTSFYFSKYLENMAKHDYQKATLYNYVKYQSENLNEKNKKGGIHYTISTEPSNEIAKYMLDIDNEILLNLNSRKLNKTEKVIKKINHNDEDSDNEEEDEYQKDNYKKVYEYDFSEFNKHSLEENCKIDIPKFFENEEISSGGLSLEKYNILKSDKICSNDKDTMKYLKYQLEVADFYQKGYFRNLNDDPDYITLEKIKF